MQYNFPRPSSAHPDIDLTSLPDDKIWSQFCSSLKSVLLDHQNVGGVMFDWFKVLNIGDPVTSFFLTEVIEILQNCDYDLNKWFLAFSADPTTLSSHLRFPFYLSEPGACCFAFLFGIDMSSSPI